MSGPMSVVEPQSFPAGSAVPATEKRKAATRTAVLVVHGMGQQRKFETLGAVVAGIERVTGDARDKRASEVEIGDDRFSRMEVDLADGRGVDVYEGYWAPITEGQVTLRDVMAFLGMGAWNGLRNAKRTFKRWVFGEQRDFPCKELTRLMLLLVAGVIAALAFMNFLTIALASGKAIRTGPPWLQSANVINDLTALILILLAVAAGFGAVYFAGSRQKRSGFVSRLGLWHFIATAVFTVLTAATMLLAIGFHRKPVYWISLGLHAGVLLTFGAAAMLAAAALLCLVAVFRSRKPLLDFLNALIAGALAVSVVLLGAAVGAESMELSIFDAMPRWELAWWSGAVLRVVKRWVAVWIVLAGMSAFVRSLLVQYIGDVAAYVTPSSLDRFDTIRTRIKDSVFKTVDAVYRAESNGAMLYDSVIVVGHSLGAVAAYDGVNRILNEDRRTAGGIDAQKRTKGIVTFGAPLDKTAFIFETNVSELSRDRAALAATVQPLVSDRTTLAIPWKNIHSKWDIISGELDYYSVPGEPNRVENMIDPDAVTPIGAHNEYWKNDLVWNCVVGFIPK